MVTRAAGDLQLVRCSADGLTVGVEVNRIAAVERDDRLTRYPTATAPGRFRTQRGEWPVFALPGAGRVGAVAGQVLLVDGPRGRVGLWVERVAPVERVPRAALAELPAGLSARDGGAFACVALTASGPLPVLAVDALGAPVRDVPAAPESGPDAGAARATPPADARMLAFGHTEHAVGGRTIAFAVPLWAVTEVFDPSPGAALPGAGDHVRELVVWRDRPLAVIDAARWAGLPAAPPSRRVVVLRSGEWSIGVSAGASVQVVTGTTACVVSRRGWPFRLDRVSACFDTDRLSLVVLNFFGLFHVPNASET